MNNLSHEKKTSNTIKTDRKVHRVTINPNKASDGEILHIPVPKLDDGVVLVLRTLALIVNLAVSGHANGFLMNNVARVLVRRQIRRMKYFSMKSFTVKSSRKIDVELSKWKEIYV